MMVAEINSGIRKLDPNAASEMIRAGKVRVIDVREPDEYATEHLERAENMPLSGFDAARLRDCKEPLLVYCRSGQRSMDAAKQLASAIGDATAPEILMLEGGLLNWSKHELDTVRDVSRSKVSIMRQVQITVGLLNLIGFALAWFISPWFLGIPIFTSAGLLFAGTTGTCGMALILQKMPWN